tara:strand:- start:90 stop:398 length:309 start_codon:yes stop_codon:yes gene_type:complete
MGTKWRGYVVAKRGPKGRQAMRATGKTHDTRATAKKKMQSQNERWMKMNYGPKFGDPDNFEYGAVPAGKFAKGPEGNKELLKWHDEKKTRVTKIKNLHFFEY